MNTFFLGTHEVSWLGRLDVPLFISFQRLRNRRSIPRALAPWALDSGGFTELSQRGRWTIGADQYAERALELSEEAGQLVFAAIQDWMCEPAVRAKTGLKVEDHQWLTCYSFCELRELAPSVPWAPVLQGWEFDDYLRHAEEWERWQVDLRAAPIVGLGSVCRRQSTTLAEDLVRVLSAEGISLHLFGFKALGLQRCHESAFSADSMAWSFAARQRRVRLPGCRHQTCANCILWARAWRDELLRSLGEPSQEQSLAFMCAPEPARCVDRCPLCWSDELCAPSHDFWAWCCSACGHEWGCDERDAVYETRRTAWEVIHG